MNLAVAIVVNDTSSRINSQMPQVLQPALGKPLLQYVLEAAKSLYPVDIILILKTETEQNRSQIEDAVISWGYRPFFAIQSLQLGDNLTQIRAQLQDKADYLLVIPGDLPLLTSQTLQKLINIYQSSQTQTIRQEPNTGISLIRTDWLWKKLEEISLESKTAHSFIDLVNYIVRPDEQLETNLLEDKAEAVSVKNCAHLAFIETVLRQRVNQKWMEAGIVMIDPATVYIDHEVTLGQETIIYPNTYLYGKTTIGENCVIGPNSYVENSTIGHNCVVRFSVIEQAVLEDHVDIGPFAHLRKGAHLAEGVHMGNFGEVKNSYLGPGTKMGHFSYLGDTTTGKNVNIGAGTITCNYDGVNKNLTKIGDNAFIGSDTMLVAPVTIGENAKTGAGSVVTKDVPNNSLAYGVPARIKNLDLE